MKVIKCFPIVLLLALLLNAPVLSYAAEQPDSSRQKTAIENYLSSFKDPALPPLPGMEDPEQFEMFAFADKDRDEHESDRRKHAERIQLFRLWKIMEEVDLTEEQVDKFFPLMREYGKQERELAAQRGKLLHTLRKELREENLSDARLAEALDQLKVNSSKIVEAKNKAIEDAAKILDVKQQARLALSLHDVERNIWESIARVRHLGGADFNNFDFDKKKLHMNMEQLREHLDKLQQEFESQGIIAPDIQIDVKQKQDKVSGQAPKDK